MFLAKKMPEKKTVCRTMKTQVGSSKVSKSFAVPKEKKSAQHFSNKTVGLIKAPTNQRVPDIIGTYTKDIDIQTNYSPMPNNSELEMKTGLRLSFV